MLRCVVDIITFCLLVKKGFFPDNLNAIKGNEYQKLREKKTR